LTHSLLKPKDQPRTCEQCGAEFVISNQTRGEKRFCSKQCKNKASAQRRWLRRNPSGIRKHAPIQYRGTMQLECFYCTKQFEVPATRMRDKQRFCSAKCFYEWRRHRLTGKGVQYSLFGRNQRQIRPKHVEKRCKGCGKQFYAYGRQMFCSRECHRLASVIYLTCEGCGKEIRLFRYQGSRRFCNRECVSLYYKTHPHPSWRGERRQERGKNWPDQIIAARKRDADRCQVEGCEYDGQQKPSVDHIIAYRIVKDINPLLDPNHLDNLICLCRKHHAIKTHIAERRLLEGDVIGFWREAIRIIPDERLRVAFAYFRFRAPARPFEQPSFAEVPAKDFHRAVCWKHQVGL